MFTKKRKENRACKNFKFWPTQKLKEVIDENFHRGVNGFDYFPYIEEIRDIYFLRLNKILNKQIKELTYLAIQHKNLEALMGLLKANVYASTDP